MKSQPDQNQVLWFSHLKKIDLTLSIHREVIINICINYCAAAAVQICWLTGLL